jgi:hypothetical protein
MSRSIAARIGSRCGRRLAAGVTLEKLLPGSLFATVISFV